MRPEEAWETVKGNLRSEMPKGTFDERVRAARLVGFDHDVFTIAAPDTFTRAWLENRLTQTLTRQLRGVLNTELRVEFITESPINEAIEAGETSPSTLGIEHEPIPPSGTESFRPFQTDLHNLITRPHAQTVIPAYLLRWLPYLGPDGGWFLVAMYQAFYFSENTRVSSENEGTLFQVSRNWLRTWSGLGTNKIAALLEATSLSVPDNFISWFLKGTNPPKGKARQYCFRVEMPLTPGDLEALTTWLRAHGIEENPIAALEQAVNTPVRDILPFPAQPPASHHTTLQPNPTTVLALIHTLTGDKLTAATYARVTELARQLQTNLLPPGDNLHLTHYFLRNWIKRLKPGPAWIVAILRDKGFQDTARGILRDRVQLHTGYQELAVLLGVSEERISDWLPPLSEKVRSQSQNGSPKRAWLYQQKSRQQIENFIISKTGTIDTRGGQTTSYTFRIRLDDPLVDNHAKIFFLLEALLWQYANKEKDAGLACFVSILNEALEMKRGGVEIKQPQNGKASSLEVENKQVEQALGWNLNKLLEGWSGLRAGPGVAEVEIKQVLQWTPRDIKVSLLKFFNLKVLYEIQQLLLQTCLPGEKAAAGQEKDANKGGWTVSSVMQMLARGGIQASKRGRYQKRLEAHPERLHHFVGWLIYGYANKTTATRQGIDAPLFYSLSRFENDRPLPVYLSLAKKPPNDLVELLQNPYSRQLPKLEEGVLRQAKENGLLDLLRVIEKKE